MPIAVNNYDFHANDAIENHWTTVWPGYTCVAPIVPTHTVAQTYAVDSSKGNPFFGHTNSYHITGYADGYSPGSCVTLRAELSGPKTVGSTFDEYVIDSEGWDAWAIMMPNDYGTFEAYGMSHPGYFITHPSYGQMSFMRNAVNTYDMVFKTGHCPSPAGGTVTSDEIGQPGVGDFNPIGPGSSAATSNKNGYAALVNLLGPSGIAGPCTYNVWHCFYMYMWHRAHDNGIIDLYYRQGMSGLFTKAYSNRNDGSAVMNVAPHPTMQWNLKYGAPGEGAPYGASPGVTVATQLYRSAPNSQRDLWHAGMRRRSSQVLIEAEFFGYIFKGDFETGNGSQWDAKSDKTTYPTINAGLASVVSSHTPASGPIITASSGATTTAFSWQELKPPLSGQTADRAEYQKLYSWAAYDGQTYFYTFSIILDPDFNWNSAWTADATNTHFHPVIAQLAYRNIFTPCLIHVHPTGWQSTTAMAMSMFAVGGSAVVGTSTEHRLAVNADWTTLTNPVTAAGGGGSQRFPQLIGPNTQQGLNRPFTAGAWHEIVIEIKHVTDTATGYYRAYHRERGSGQNFAKVLETTATYKTQVWGSGEPAHANGPDDRHAFGGYVYGLPQMIHFGIDQFTISTSLAQAQAVFATEAPLVSAQSVVLVG